MPRALRTIIALLGSTLVCSCMSYPELVAAGEKDASLSPDGPAQAIGQTEDRDGDGGEAAKDAAPDALAEGAGAPAPPSEPASCSDCPSETRCCETKGGKGKGARVIVCKPRDADCDD